MADEFGNVLWRYRTMQEAFGHLDIWFRYDIGEVLEYRRGLDLALKKIAKDLRYRIPWLECVQ